MKIDHSSCGLHAAVWRWSMHQPAVHTWRQQRLPGVLIDRRDGYCRRCIVCGPNEWPDRVQLPRAHISIRLQANVVTGGSVYGSIYSVARLVTMK